MNREFIISIIAYICFLVTTILTCPVHLNNAIPYWSFTSRACLNSLNRLQQEIKCWQSTHHRSNDITQILTTIKFPIPPPLPPEPYYVSNTFKRKSYFCGKGRGVRAKKRKIAPIDNYGSWSDDQLMEFTHMTRFEFLEMYYRVREHINKPREYYMLRNGKNSKFRGSKLSAINRLLLVCTWMGSYLKYSVLAYQFGVSKSFVCQEIRHIVPIIMCSYIHEVVLPNHVNLINSSKIDKLVIGAIDATHFRINRPSIDQAVYYRGDKHIHSLIGQALVDLQGRFLHFTVGYPGSKNDKDILFFSELQHYLQGVMVLVDSGYNAKHFKHGINVVLPTSAIIRAKPDLYVQHKSERVVVEMSFGYVKRLTALSSRWRQRKSLLPYVAMAAVLVSNHIFKTNPLIKTMPNVMV